MAIMMAWLMFPLNALSGTLNDTRSFISQSQATFATMKWESDVASARTPGDLTFPNINTMTMTWTTTSGQTEMVTWSQSGGNLIRSKDVGGVVTNSVMATGLDQSIPTTFSLVSPSTTEAKMVMTIANQNPKVPLIQIDAIGSEEQ